MSYSYSTLANHSVAQPVTVTNLNDSGTGSLRDAIANAQAGDTIRFAPHLANQTIVLTSGQLEIPAGKNLVIDGIDAPNLTISDKQTHRIFALQPGTVAAMSLTIKNLRLANGVLSDRNAAIDPSDQGALQLENIKFAHSGAANDRRAEFNTGIKFPAPSNQRFWHQLRALQSGFKQRSVASYH